MISVKAKDKKKKKEKQKACKQQRRKPMQAKAVKVSKPKSWYYEGGKDHWDQKAELTTSYALTEGE